MVWLLCCRVFSMTEHLNTVWLLQEKHVAIAVVFSPSNREAHRALHQAPVFMLKDAEERVLQDVADTSVELSLGVADADAQGLLLFYCYLCLSEDI